MDIDGDFVKGVAYFLGDGRMTAPRSISTVNQNPKTIKFFIKWLKKYFKINIKDIKIKIKVSNPAFDKEQILIEFSKKLNLDKSLIHSVSMKENSKPRHKLLFDVWVNNAEAKRLLDNLILKVKSRCLKNKKLAREYIKGIYAAEGSPKYHIKSGSRSIHLKMKNESEIRYIGKLLNGILKIKSSILKVNSEEGMWLITLGGYYELKKAYELDIFEIESEKRERLKKIIKSYEYAQVKKGEVDKFYLEKLNFFNKKLKRNLTAPELAKFIKRDRTRTIYVLRNLEKRGLIIGKRRKSVGRAFEFKIKG